MPGVMGKLGDPVVGTIQGCNAGLFHCLLCLNSFSMLRKEKKKKKKKGAVGNLL